MMHPRGHPAHPEMQLPIPSGPPEVYAARAAVAAEQRVREGAKRDRERVGRSEALAKWRASLPDLDAVRTGSDLAAFCRAIDADRYPFPSGGLGPGFGFTRKPVGWLRVRRFSKNYTIGTSGPSAQRVVMSKASDHCGPDWHPASNLVVAAESGHLAHITTHPGSRRRTRIRWIGPTQQLPDDLRDGVVAWLKSFVSSQR